MNHCSKDESRGVKEKNPRCIAVYNQIPIYAHIYKKYIYIYIQEASMTHQKHLVIGSVIWPKVFCYHRKP